MADRHQNDWLKVERREDGGVDTRFDTALGRVVLRLTEAEAREYVRQISAALGDGFERTFATEAARG